MGSLSIWHWMIVVAVVLLLFGGRGKISDLMGDVAKGIKAFKQGMSDEETADAAKPDAAKSIDHQPRGQAARRKQGVLTSLAAAPNRQRAGGRHASER